MLVPRQLVMGAIVLAAAGCSDATGPEAYAGTYGATQFEFISTEDPTQTVDLITVGLGVYVTITADGTLTVDVPGGSASGTITIDGSNVTLSLPGLGPARGVIRRSGETVTIHLTEGVMYDFSDDSVKTTWPTRPQDEPATLRITMSLVVYQ